MSRNRRPDEAYEIAALTKGLAVLEALEGTSFEPVSVKRIINRCQLPRDVVERSLKTYRLRGWADQNDRGDWMIGQRFVRMAQAASAAFPGENLRARKTEAGNSPLSY